MSKFEITKINPSDYDLTEDKAQQIEQSFKPLIIERENLIPIYESILTAELTPELTEKAKELRKKLVKLRTSTAAIHKVEKAFFLAAGRFVDAWKNKNTVAIQEMESRLVEIENYYVNLEKQRIAELNETRRAELIAYVESEELIPSDLGNMNDNVYENYKSGLIAAYKARKEAELKAEQERIERERKEKLFNERRFILAEYKQFIISTDVFTIDTNEADYNDLLSELKNRKAKHEAEQEQIRIENERLKKEAEEKENIRQAELKRHQEAIEKQKKEAEEKFKKEQAELKAKADAERIEREKIEAELKAKQEAELKAKQEAERLAELELQKGDADKFNDLITDLQTLKTKYSFESAKNKKMYADVNVLIDKVIAHIQK